MARGTTRSPRRKSPPPRAGFRLPGWLWALLGIVGGVFITKHFFSQPPAPVQTTGPVQQAPVQPPATGKGKVKPAQQTQAPTQEAAPAPAEAEKKDTPTFEFYTLLPASEVVAPGENAPSRQQTQRTQPAQATTPAPATRQPTAPASPAPSTKPAPAAATATPRPAPAAPAAATNESAPVRTLLQAASFRSRDDANALAGKFRDMGLVMQVLEVKTADGNLWYRVQSGPYTNQAELSRAQGLMQARGVNPMVMRQR